MKHEIGEPELLNSGNPLSNQNAKAFHFENYS